VRGRGEVNEPGWVGIDFGTTNSAVAIADAAGEAHLVPCWLLVASCWFETQS
jgi:hypothetical protein